MNNKDILNSWIDPKSLEDLALELKPKAPKNNADTALDQWLKGHLGAQNVVLKKTPPQQDPQETAPATPDADQTPQEPLKAKEAEDPLPSDETNNKEEEQAPVNKEAVAPSDVEEENKEENPSVSSENSISPGSETEEEEKRRIQKRIPLPPNIQRAQGSEISKPFSAKPAPVTPPPPYPMQGKASAAISSQAHDTTKKKTEHSHGITTTIYQRATKHAHPNQREISPLSILTPSSLEHEHRDKEPERRFMQQTLTKIRRQAQNEGLLHARLQEQGSPPASTAPVTLPNEEHAPLEGKEAFTAPDGPLNTRLKAYAHWVKKSFPQIKELFLSDQQGMALYKEEGSSARLPSVASLLAEVTQRATKHLEIEEKSGIYLEVGNGISLNVIPILHDKKIYGLGLLSPKSLTRRQNQSLKEALFTALKES